MDDKVYKYRKKHPKCKYCKFHKAYIRGIGIQEFYFQECTAKDKYIEFENLPRWFCKCYEVDKEKI